MEKYSISQLNDIEKSKIVCHLTHKWQHDFLKRYCPRMSNFVKGFSYYLTPGDGKADSADMYKSPSYKIIEFNQVDFGFEIKHIGFVCPMDLYNGEFKKGDILVLFKLNNQPVKYGAYVKKGYDEKGFHSLPKEIVEDWEPVIEELFKKGDWITTFDEPNENNPHERSPKNGGSGFEPKKTLKINEIIKDDKSIVYFFENHSYGIFSGNFRHSTPEEIGRVDTVILPFGKELKFIVYKSKDYAMANDRSNTKVSKSTFSEIYSHFCHKTIGGFGVCLSDFYQTEIQVCNYTGKLQEINEIIIAFNSKEE